MSASLLKKYVRAVAKRDKWAKRVAILASQIGSSLSEVTAGAEPTDQLTPDQLALCRRGKKYHGAFARLSRELGTHPNTVGAVANGRLQSKRIMLAIRKELERIDSLPSDPSIIPLSEEEIAAFRSGGRYWGLMATTARKIGVGKTTVSEASRHPHSYKTTFLALRGQMALIDAELSIGIGGAL